MVKAFSHSYQVIVVWPLHRLRVSIWRNPHQISVRSHWNAELKIRIKYFAATNKKEGNCSDLASFQKDSSSSFGMTSVAFSMRAATTASMIWKSCKLQNFSRHVWQNNQSKDKLTNHHHKTNNVGREESLCYIYFILQLLKTEARVELCKIHRTHVVLWQTFWKFWK